MRWPDWLSFFPWSLRWRSTPPRWLPSPRLNRVRLRRRPRKPQAPRKKDQPRVEGSYASEAEAKKACADGSVVWVNSRSRIYHAAATRDYGKTRQGFYMCQAQAERSGFRAVKGPPENTRKKAEKKV